jgi:hypothetical protein
MQARGTETNPPDAVCAVLYVWTLTECFNDEKWMEKFLRFTKEILYDSYILTHNRENIRVR